MSEASRNRFVIGLQNVARDLKSIANLSPGPTQAEEDVQAVVSQVAARSEPTSVVDLNGILKWDPDRLAEVLTYASEQGRVAMSQIKGRTFVGLPPSAA